MTFDSSLRPENQEIVKINIKELLDTINSQSKVIIEHIDKFELLVK